MQFGKFILFSLSDGKFKLDGGAMFGIIPKVLWERLAPADTVNRIELGLHPLLIKTPQNTILIDTGIGDKYNEKQIQMFGITHTQRLVDSLLSTVQLTPSQIDYVILTHLHFDHCGGNTYIAADGKLTPTFPHAKYIIQRGEWQSAIQPNERTKGSYSLDNLLPLEEHNQLRLIDGDYEVVPGVKTVVTGGHTKHHQIVFIETERQTAVFLGDIIPTTSHIQLPYIMGYDLYPLETLEQKKQLITSAIENRWLIFWEHDPKIQKGYLKQHNQEIKVEPV